MGKLGAFTMSVVGTAIHVSVVSGCVERDDGIGSAASVDLPAAENETPNGAAADVINITAGEDEVLFFHEHGCPDCEVVREEFLPRFLALQGLALESVRSFDVDRPEAVKALLALERRLGFQAESLRRS